MPNSPAAPGRRFRGSRGAQWSAATAVHARGRARARQRGARRIDARAPVRRRRVLGARERARASRITTRCGASSPPCARADRARSAVSRGLTPRAPALRPLRRPLRARDADPRARRAGERVPPRTGRPRVRARAREPSCATSPDARRRCIEARRLSEAAGCRVFLKREDLLHTGAHKINNTIGQCLLTRRMGKPRVIAETGAGQHGVATAAAAARFGLECTVYMGAEDARRQHLNVRAHEAAGRRGARGGRRQPHAQGRHQRGAARLGDARARHALRARLGARTASVPDHGARLPPRDRDRGARAVRARWPAGCPDVLVACVGGGSNAIGLFHAFLGDRRGAQGGRRGRRARPRERPARGARARAQRRRAARHAHADAPGRERHGARDALGLGRPRLPGARPRARLAGRPGSSRSTRTRPTTRRSRRSKRCRGSRASCPRSSARTPSRGCCARGARSGATRAWWSTSRAAATRTWRRCCGSRDAAARRRATRRTRGRAGDASARVCYKRWPLRP